MQQAERSGEIGSILIGAGVLSIWLDRFLQREQAEIDEQRLRRLLREQAPAIRDAVLDGFAANKPDLERVATPETLDRIITTGLGLRLRDERFAAEIYQDIRGQAIGPLERWHDATLSVDLSPLPDVWQDKRRQHRSSGPFFAVTLRWEYTTVPRHAERRFVCLSDREEYAELAASRGSTSAWFFKPGSGVDVDSPEAFELLRFAVDGEERRIRRTTRKGAQTYAVSVGSDAVAAGKPVTVTYTIRTITQQSGHLLFFDIEQPTRNLRVDFDYSECGIASISALDLVPSIKRTRIERTPDSLPGQNVRVDIDGWIFPRSGIAFVWSLEDEIRRS
jgi:hypothetical protein